MPSDDSSVRDALNHQSLKVSRDDPGPRPMIAVLDAPMFARAGITTSPDPDAFAAAAGHVAVFQIRPAPPARRNEDAP